MQTTKPDKLSPGWLGESRPLACVIGLGLIGGSWAGALHSRGWWVSAVDQCPESLERALQMGWIDQGYVRIPEFLDCDLIVLSLPLAQLLDSLGSLAGRIRPGAVVTDVSSLKAKVCETIPLLLGSQVFFVGGHPMTGSEKSGFAAAEPGLFRGYPYVLTPAGCSQEALAGLTILLQDFGAQVVLREPERHDAEVAMVSHIPHLMAVALTLAAEDISLQGDSALELAGPSFRESTRVAESSPEMWQEILTRNSAMILAGLDAWEKRFNELKTFIEAGDGEGIAKAFLTAAQARKKIR